MPHLYWGKFTSGEADHDNGTCQPGSHGHDTPKATPELLPSRDYDRQSPLPYRRVATSQS